MLIAAQARQRRGRSREAERSGGGTEGRWEGTGDKPLACVALGDVGSGERERLVAGIVSHQLVFGVQALRRFVVRCQKFKASSQ